MSDLTGIRLVMAPALESVRARIQLSEQGMQLYSRLEESPEVIGHKDVWARLIHVKDQDAVNWGSLENEGKVVLAMKSFAHHTSIYTFSPVLPASFLRGLARYAGVHIYHDRNDTFYVSKSFLCLNADGAGKRVLNFPQPVDLSDPFTGKTQLQNATQNSFHLNDKETKLIRYAAVH